MQETFYAGQRIGVLDSGVGGLTVVKQLEKLLPGEDILYYGDSANCPYGTREEFDIRRLVNHILDFMESEKVKAIVVACNTLSVLYDMYAPMRSTPIFSIVDAGAACVLRQKLERVGLIGTEFTIKSGRYKSIICKQQQGVFVSSASNRELAALVDCGDEARVPDNIRKTLEALRAQGDVKHVIFGCTHYPIVRDVFEKEAPDIVFIDPACEQARIVRQYLEEKKLLNPKSTHRLEIHTSGNPENYRKVCKKLGIEAEISCARLVLGK